MSSYSNLKIELIGTGDQAGTWGNTTNTNFQYTIDSAISGTVDISFSSADVTLTLTNSNSAQTAKNLRLNLIGTSGGARNLTIPASFTKFYVISNNLADIVTVQNPTGTTYAIPAGRVAQVYCTGTGVYPAIDYLSGAILSSAAVILGGSINSTAIGNLTPSTGAFTTLSASSTTSFPTPTAGDNTTKGATTAFVTTAITNATSALGTMSTQNASAVSITGGTISGTTVSTATVNTSSIYGTAIAAGSFVVGNIYTIASVGTTSFTSIGASANTVGITFVATGAGSGTGTAYNYYVGSNSTGAKTISTSTPSGGSDGDIWYQIT
jgi:hypothetical protein